ncbi:hypothetical protein ALP64_203766 [Pseudomonas syringae pv. actinidiae]|nr:hypothetical protein ALP64_203766 [Pseudomonas syringae pv. actinidiae]
MTEIAFQCITHLDHQRAEVQPFGEGHTHGADLGKVAQCGLEVRAGTVEQRQPDHPFLALRRACEVHMQGRQQHMKRRSIVAFGELFQARMQYARKRLHPGVGRCRVGCPAIVIAGHQQGFWQTAVFVQPVGLVLGEAWRCVITGVVDDEIAVARRVEFKAVALYLRSVQLPQ